MAGIHSYIRRLPDGYNTIINEEDEYFQGQKLLT